MKAYVDPVFNCLRVLIVTWHLLFFETRDDPQNAPSTSNVFPQHTNKFLSQLKVSYAKQSHKENG